MARERSKGVIICKKPGHGNTFSKKMQERKKGRRKGVKEEQREGEGERKERKKEETMNR